MMKRAVLVPGHQRTDLAKILRDAGAEPFFVELSPARTLKWEASENELKAADMVIVASKKAVMASADWHVVSGRLVAVGARTAAALGHAGAERVEVPAVATAMGVLEHLGSVELRGLNILLPQGVRHRAELADGLRERGARVTSRIVYQIDPPSRADRDKIIAKQDCLFGACLTSPAVCDTLYQLIPNAFSRLWLGAIGTTTDAHLATLGHKVDVVPKETSLRELVKAAAQAYGAGDGV